MKMHELLDRQEKWTQGAPARDAEGRPVDAVSSKATCFCLAGAGSVCYGSNWPSVRELIREHIDQRFIFIWNDKRDRTFAEVRALLLELDI